MSIHDDLGKGLTLTVPVVWPDDLLNPADWINPREFRHVKLRRTPRGVEASMEDVIWAPDPDYARNLANEALSRLHPGWDAYAAEVARQKELRAKMGWT